jgi:hypothetical protein
MKRVGVALSLFLLLVGAGAPAGQSDLQTTFDHVLDTYVRDGYVYYHALQRDRAGLDRYVASLDTPRKTVESWAKPVQEAFWVNAYNAIVLRTVIDAYPIRVRSTQYPAKSIRQIPGAFDALKHRVGGDSLTLDEMEKNVIAKFGDARLVLALGRAALGSGRLHSEVYLGSNLDSQLDLVIKECAERISCIKIDRDKSLIEVTPIVSWREDVFVQTFAADGRQRWPNRTPVEQAVAAMAYPRVFFSEREFLTANTFQMKYGEFDWRLNDLTGGVPE